MTCAFEASFFVAGQPAPKGSYSARLIGGRAIPFAQGAAKIKAWERAVRTVASRYIPEGGPLAVPVRVELTFSMRRPKKPRFRVPAVVPDLDKITRSTIDALSRHLFVDDSLVCALRAKKIYGDIIGVWILVQEMDGGPT